MLHVDLDELKMARMTSMRAVDGISVIDMHYLIGTAEGVTYEVEEHRLGLFTWDQYREAFEAAGMETTVEIGAGPMGRGLVTARRPS
jgi:hypothetical protein